MDSRAEYTARLNRVLDYIDHHLAETLDLQTLAGVAHFSAWHFHRLFLAMKGETLADCVRRHRLEAAANRLLGHPATPVLTIALEVGFQSAEVFSRAFRQHFGVSPTAWRQGAHREWRERQKAEHRKIHQAARKRDQAAGGDCDDDTNRLSPRNEAAAMNVSFRTFPDTRVAYLRHIGPYGMAPIPQLWPRLERWIVASGLDQPPRPCFGLSHDHPEITAPEHCRYDACVAVDDAFRAQGEIGIQVIPGGRYAAAAFEGTPADFHAAWTWFCGEWLPASGMACDDRPGFEFYDTDFAVDPATGRFRCLLCLPVRPL